MESKRSTEEAHFAIMVNINALVTENGLLEEERHEAVKAYPQTRKNNDWGVQMQSTGWGDYRRGTFSQQQKAE